MRTPERARQLALTLEVRCLSFPILFLFHSSFFQEKRLDLLASGVPTRNVLFKHLRRLCGNQQGVPYFVGLGFDLVSMSDTPMHSLDKINSLVLAFAIKDLPGMLYTHQKRRMVADLAVLRVRSHSLAHSPISPPSFVLTLQSITTAV